MFTALLCPVRLCIVLPGPHLNKQIPKREESEGREKRMSKRLVFEGKHKGYTLRETAHDGRKHNDRHTCSDCRIIEKGITVLTMEPIEKLRPR